MNRPAEWRNIEFARVIACKSCTTATDSKLLRDDGENVPQPGYIGSNYRNVRVLLVGQNPGTPKSLAEEDLHYTAALRALRDEPTIQRYKQLRTVLRTFILRWPVQNNHFPLTESGLTLDDIAYCNIVRCRTANDSKPGETLAKQCLNGHFIRWLNLLKPKVVVFIGKWAWRQGGNTVSAQGIPCTFINRQRSLSADERVENRAQAVALVRKYRG